MRKEHFRGLLTLLLIETCLGSIGIYNRSFSNYFDQSNGGIYNTPDLLSTYELGEVPEDSTVIFTFTMPSFNQTSYLFNSLPNFLQFYYYDPNEQMFNKNEAKASDGNNFQFPLMDNSKPNYQYTATYVGGLNGMNYRLIIFSSGSFSYLDWMNVHITVNGKVVVNTLDFIRNILQLMIYIDKQDTYNFSAYPAQVPGGDSTISFVFQVATLKVSSDKPNPYLTGNHWSVVETNSSIKTQEQKANQLNPTYTDNVAHYKVDLAPGYYLIMASSVQSDPDIAYSWVTYPSEKYQCPYSEDLLDTFKEFQPCVRNLPSKSTSFEDPGLPCSTYNNVTGLCTSCINGYYLQKGQCMANTTCPPRQYFHFGQCFPVNALCDTFDAFTGDCLTCANPQNYNLLNGSCVAVVVQCGARQWQLNNSCLNVSAACNSFDPSNGRCLSCLAEGDEVKADGSCAPVVLNCPDGTYQQKLVCVRIPNECFSFNASLGLCLTCIRGYSLKNGVCERIQCPPRQFSSSEGLCLAVSDLCDSYDPIGGGCLSCKDRTMSVSGGRCTQIASPLAGCMERQQLGFGPCVGADVNCRLFNLISGDCQQCSFGFSFDYTGKCAPNPNCTAQQWVSNGQCLQYPQNCVRVDSVGLCTQCVNADYRLTLGQCVFFKRCADRQFLSSAGQCVDVSQECGLFNPSNGNCVTCRAPTVSPVKGVCCPAGQSYSLAVGRCVDASTASANANNENGPVCLSFHPSLNYCLACSQGSFPDYSVPYRCA